MAPYGSLFIRSKGAPDAGVECYRGASVCRSCVEKPAWSAGRLVPASLAKNPSPRLPSNPLMDQCFCAARCPEIKLLFCARALTIH
jgi:hypothetical protein